MPTQPASSPSPSNERAFVVCTIRARNYRRTDPRQDRCFETRGYVDGRQRALGYDCVDGQLVINPAEAERVKLLFRQYSSWATQRYARLARANIWVVDHFREELVKSRTNLNQETKALPLLHLSDCNFPDRPATCPGENSRTSTRTRGHRSAAAVIR